MARGEDPRLDRARVAAPLAGRCRAVQNELGGVGGLALRGVDAAGSLLIKTGKGYISTFSINTAATGSLTIYDGINATGTVIAVIDTSKNTANSAFSPWPIQTGLFVVLVGNADITIISR